MGTKSGRLRHVPCSAVHFAQTNKQLTVSHVEYPHIDDSDGNTRIAYVLCPQMMVFDRKEPIDRVMQTCQAKLHMKKKATGAAVLEGGEVCTCLRMQLANRSIIGCFIRQPEMRVHVLVFVCEWFLLPCTSCADSEKRSFRKIHHGISLFFGRWISVESCPRYSASYEAFTIVVQATATTFTGLKACTVRIHEPS